MVFPILSSTISPIILSAQHENYPFQFIICISFAITSPNTANVSWNLGSTQTITWSVAGTTGSGINTANVNILFSTDGGATFPTVLAANTANDGSESVTLPNTASPSCRILIQPVGNIYYAVSKNIALGYTISTACNTYTNTTPLATVIGPTGLDCESL